MQLADQFRALGAGMSLKVSSLLQVALEGHKTVAPLLPCLANVAGHHRLACLTGLLETGRPIGSSVC